MVKNTFSVRPAVRTDTRQIAELIQVEERIHRHLDWRNPLDWISSSPYLVLESRGKVGAVLGCPPDPPKVAWLRLFACAGKIPLDEAWKSLWTTAREMLASSGRATAAAIVLQGWFKELLLTSGFQTHQEIVMLKRQAIRPPPRSSLLSETLIRPMMHYDLPGVASADASAFNPLWQNSPVALSHAFSQTTWATVAESDEGIVGYQMSTRNLQGGHLARLAVRPEIQNRGVGTSLVTHLINLMAGQGLSHLTVNTQSDNQASLALYQKLGFEETGDRYPVFIDQV